MLQASRVDPQSIMIGSEDDLSSEREPGSCRPAPKTKEARSRMGVSCEAFGFVVGAIKPGVTRA